MDKQLTVGDQVVHICGQTTGWGSSGAGTIKRIIAAHQSQYPPRWVEAKAVVAWPAPARIGGSGVMHTTIKLSALARPDEMGICDKCHRRRRIYPVSGDGQQCGTCIHREERRINTREMYHGHGRRGY